MAEVPVPVTGRLSGSAEARVALQRLREVAAWQVNGNARVQDSQINNYPPLAASAEFRLQEGVLTASRLSGTLQQAQLAGTARMELAGDFKYSSRLRLAVRDLSMLNRLTPDLQLPVEIGGQGNLDGQITGGLSPWTLHASGSGSTMNLSVESRKIESLRFDFSTDTRVLELTRLAANFAGGTVGGSITAPLGDLQDKRVVVDLSWTDVDVAKLVEQFNVISEPVQGTAAGKLTAEASASKLTDLNAWKADGQTALRGIAAFGWQDAQIDSEFSLSAGTVLIRRLTAVSNRENLESSGRIEVDQPFKFEAKISVTNGDLAKLEDLPLPLRTPVTLAGRYNTAGTLSGQLQPLRLIGDGVATARDVTADDVKIDALKFDFASDGHRLTVQNLSASFYEGQARGSFRIPLDEELAGSADATWENVNLGGLLNDLGLLAEQVAGQASGSIGIATPPGKLADPMSWKASGNVSFAQAQLWGWSTSAVTTQFELADQQLTVSNFRGRLDESAVELAGRVQVIAPFQYAGNIKLSTVDLAKLNELPEPVRPPVQVDGLLSLAADVQGTLEPLRLTGSGSGSAEHVVVDKVRTEAFQFRFDADGRRLALRDVTAQLYGGSATLSAEIPLDATTPGTGSLRWEQVDVGGLSQDLDLIQLPFAVDATASGRLDASVPQGKLADLTAWTIKGSISAPSIQANSVPVGDLSGELSYGEQTLQYRLQGTFLDGVLEANGTWPFASAQMPDQPPEVQPGGTFRIEGLQLARVAQVEPRYERFDPLTGSVDLSLVFRHEAESNLPVGDGTVVLTGLKWDRIELADRLQGRIRLSGEQFEFEDLAGTYAGGRLRAAAIFFVSEPDRSWFTVTLTGADTEKAFAAWPELTSWLEGTVDIQLRGNLGRQWRASGTASLREADVGGVRMVAIRLPLAGSFDPATGRGQLLLRSSSAQLARGRTTGDIRLTWSRGLDLEGKLRFSQVDLQTLLRQMSPSSQLGRGKITGTFDFSGRDVRSLRDMQGLLQADLRDTQAMAFPLMSSVLPYLSGASSSTTFDQGEVRARLAGGIVRLERLSLASRNVNVFVAGTITTTGRLNLNVVASTQQLGQNARLARMLLARLPLAVPTPVSALAAAVQYLEDRVIYLDVTGTIRSPTVRVRPLPMLRDEVVRFFLNQAGQVR
jgi:hypothetical protein